MEFLFVLLAAFALYLLLRVNRLSSEILNLHRRADETNALLARVLKGQTALPQSAPETAPKAETKPAAAPPPAAVQTPAPSPAPKPAAPPPPKPAEAPRPATVSAPAPVETAGTWRPTPATADLQAAPKTAPPPASPKRPKISWEQQIGARLPVWIGGIAIALSGIFLVKYSIDTGLLSPAVRCALAGLLGVALLGGAQWVAMRKTVANGERIAQALAGAGIAVLYGALFAAGTVYEFFGPALTFAGMAAVTAVAVLLSLRHGAPIAMLGMVGGFLTPMLVGSAQPNAAVLFGYLTALTIGLFVVVRRQNWGWLAWPIVAASYLWVVVWLMSQRVEFDGPWLGLFLIALSAVTFAFLRPKEDGRDVAPFSWPGLVIAAAAAVLFMSVVVVRGAFGAGEWALYGVLSAGAVLLAVWDETRYRFVPWIAMAAAAALHAVWTTPDTEFYVLILAAFMALFAVTGVLMIWRSKHADEWGGLACAALLVFYLIAFVRLDEVVDAARILSPTSLIGSAPVWGILALTLAVAAALIAGRVGETNPIGRRQLLLGQFALTAILFAALAVAIELPTEAMPVAFAGLTLAAAWMAARANIDVLRPATGALAFAALWVLLPRLKIPLLYMMRTIGDGPLDPAWSSLIAAEPMLYLGLPAALIAFAAFELRRRADDLYVAVFEGAAAVLIAVMGYFLIRQGFTPVADLMTTKATPFAGALISQALLLYAIALVVIANRFARRALVVCGIAAGAVALWRILHFDIQPLELLDVWLPMAAGKVSGVIKSLPIATDPVFHLGVPAALLVGLRLALGPKRDDVVVRIAEYVAVVLIGLMGYFLIRHAFNPAAEALTAAGSRVEGGVISQAQIVYAMALVVAARFFGRTSLFNAAIAAAAIALARILAFDVQLALLTKVAIQHTLGDKVEAWLTIPAASAPLFHLALPALLLAALAFVARNEPRAWFARVCEYVVVAFAGLAVYYLIRHAFNAPEDVFAGAGTYLERGVLTNALLVVGAAATVAGTRLGRQAVWVGGIAAAVIAVLRLGFFDILTSSPLVAAHDVGSLPVLNALLLPYGIPILWLVAGAAALARRGRQAFVPYLHGGALALAFALVSLNVRQLFQGPILNLAGAPADAEVYAYSIAWLLLGIALLVWGAARRDQVMRFASLAVMILTVAKVFLYDASELTGLLRVLSFLGLGLSLLGLSWFYTRYVFGRREAEKPA